VLGAVLLATSSSLTAGARISRERGAGARDMDIEATCTVTYMSPQRLRPAEHPLLQFGRFDLPMNKAQVLATRFSAERSQDWNTTEPAGVFVRTGIRASWACSTKSRR